MTPTLLSRPVGGADLSGDPNLSPPSWGHRELALSQSGVRSASAAASASTNESSWHHRRQSRERQFCSRLWSWGGGLESPWGAYPSLTQMHGEKVQLWSLKRSAR